VGNGTSLLRSAADRPLVVNDKLTTFTIFVVKVGPFVTEESDSVEDEAFVISPSLRCDADLKKLAMGFTPGG
jgi:hypothetical protein